MKRKPGLKKPGQQTTYTYDQVQELIKCQNDPVYFIENYVYIRHAKRGRIKFAMYDYQRKMVGKYHEQRFNIVLSARQTGKTETSCAYLLWFAIFHKDRTVLVASNKGSNAMEIIRKIQFAYEELPDWLKPGIDESNWNKHTCTWENASRIVATTTSEDSGRGMSISLLYCDEIAFVKPHTAKKFWDSILPTISTGGGVILSSTPNGDIGLFAETWRQAQAGLNEFKDGVTYVPWNAPPGRDEEFKRKFIGLLGQRKWEQEYECKFLTEDLTLIDSTFITEQELAIQNKPDYIKSQEFDIHEFKFFSKPTKGAIYMVGVDPSTGSGSDFTVIQVFEFPTLKQVAELRSNILSQKIIYSKLKSLLKYLCQFSEEVYFTIERNGVGAGVLALYENDESEVHGSLISEDGKDKLGFYTTDKSKNKACLMIKDLFERRKVEMNSVATLNEFKSFVRIGPSYKASVGATDDAIMAIVQIMYIIDQFSNYNDDAFAMTMRVSPEIDQENSWELSEDEEEPLDYSADMIYVG